MAECQMCKDHQTGDPVFLVHNYPLSLPGMRGTSREQTDLGQKEPSREHMPHHRGWAAKPVPTLCFG